MTRITRVLSFAEYQAMGNEAVAKGLYRNDPRVFLPGMAWFTPWVFDPLGDPLMQGKRVMIAGADAKNAGYLSPHYWRDWAGKRAPICVVCPNGKWWQIDRKSSNGDGWAVTGELPNITCSPSIVVPGYHGWLRSGEFTPDIEGRGPSGTVQ